MPNAEAMRGAAPLALLGPAIGSFMITPSDSADLPHVTRRIVVTGTAGNVQVTFLNAAGPVTVAVLAGEQLDWAAVRIWSTSTTATNLRADY